MWSPARGGSVINEANPSSFLSSAYCQVLESDNTEVSVEVSRDTAIMEESGDTDNIEVIADSGNMDVIAETDIMEVSADPDNMEVRINMEYSNLDTRSSSCSPIVHHLNPLRFPCYLLNPPLQVLHLLLFSCPLLNRPKSGAVSEEPGRCGPAAGGAGGQAGQEDHRDIKKNG